MREMTESVQTETNRIGNRRVLLQSLSPLGGAEIKLLQKYRTCGAIQGNMRNISFQRY